MKKDMTLKVELIYRRSLDTSRHALKRITEPMREPDIREIEELLARRFTETEKISSELIRPEIITSANPENLERFFPKYKTQLFPARSDARISLILAPQHHRYLGLRVFIPKDAKKGENIHINLIKRSVKTKKVMGGIALNIHVV